MSSFKLAGTKLAHEKLDEIASKDIRDQSNCSCLTCFHSRVQIFRYSVGVIIGARESALNPKPETLKACFP